MIKYDDNGCEFHGTKIDLISELTLIMKRMVEKGVLDDDDIDQLVKTVRTPMSEIMAQNKKFFEGMSPFEKLAHSMSLGITPDELASLLGD